MLHLSGLCFGTALFPIFQEFSNGFVVFFSGNKLLLSNNTVFWGVFFEVDCYSEFLISTACFCVNVTANCIKSFTKARIKVAVGQNFIGEIGK